jgi:PadR family transcriptional regulator AphA
MSKDLSPQWVLLGLLMSKPKHGYELHQFFTPPSPLGQVWHLGLSQMYKLLRELEEQGYVEGTIEEQDTRPDRRVYHVTLTGREAVLDWLKTPVEGIRLIRVEFLCKLFLAQTLGPEMVERVIDRQTQACQGLLSELETRQPADGFEDLVLRFRSGQIKAAIDWLAQCRQTMADSGSASAAEAR